MKAALRYPRIKPANAIPSPCNRPPLLRISVFAKCPRTIAGTPVRMLKKKLHMPRIMLATALPLVGASVEKMGAGGTAVGLDAIAPARVSVPHALQNRLSSLIDSPHFGQVFMGHSQTCFGEITPLLAVLR